MGRVQNCSEADASIVLTNTCAVCLKDWLERLERLERQVLCLDQGQRVLQGQVNSVMGFALGAGAGLGASLAATYEALVPAITDAQLPLVRTGANATAEEREGCNTAFERHGIESVRRAGRSQNLAARSVAPGDGVIYPNAKGKALSADGTRQPQRCRTPASFDTGLAQGHRADSSQKKGCTSSRQVAQQVRPVMLQRMANGPSSPTPDREPGYLRVNPPTPWAVPAGLGSHHHHSHHQVPSRSPSPTTPFHAAAAAATPFPPRTPFSAASVSNSNNNNNNHYANINNRPSSRTSWYSMQSNVPSSRSGTPSEDAAAVAAAIAASEAAAATGGLAGNGAFVAALTKQFKRHMTRKYGAIETLVDASVHRVASEAKRRSLPQQRAAAVRLASARATAELSGVSPTGVSSANSSPSPTSSSRTMRWLDDDASGLDDHEKARARAWHAKRMARRKEHVLRRWMAVSNDGGTLGTLERASSPRGDDSMSSPGASPRTPPSAAESAAAEARARLSRSAASLSSAGGTVMTAVGAHPRIETSDPYELALWRMQDEANQLRRALESGGLSPMQVAMQCERLGARLSAARIGHSTPGSLRAL
ncbi:hypothetical protein PPROV_000934200 [Pycnococcus provasolii]|uniref:Uncharacterized protein n=1 Tax=Pycnococcus provasolii TaxID=41880 RepID=A0A830HYW7_9CHLO|nr:hypothetical protein PPROV_000934200 [Pycnococcus provasolii]